MAENREDAHPNHPRKLLGFGRVFWANALPAAFFVLYVAASFPTRQNVEALFQEKLAAAKYRAP